jgi:hypothetical protein
MPWPRRMVQPLLRGLISAHRLSFAVYDMAPAPQHGQLMAMRIFCFCSSSRSLRSSIARVCCSNNWCSDSALSEIRSSGTGSTSAGAGSAVECLAVKCPAVKRLVVERLAVEAARLPRLDFLCIVITKSLVSRHGVFWAPASPLASLRRGACAPLIFSHVARARCSPVVRRQRALQASPT